MSAPDVAAAPAVAPPPVERSPSEVEELSKKVFVRPLAATLSEDDIKALFPKLSVTEVQVMRRGQRHLGYGFVTFASAGEAETALERSAQSTAEDAVKVERLKHTATESAAARKARITREPKKKAPRVKKTPKEETAEDETKSAVKTKAKAKTSPKPATVTPALPSETLVFVANVDWAVGPKELQEFFEKDTDLKVEQVTIASRLVRVPPPTGEEQPAEEEGKKKRVAVRRSRGYAFVRFASHEQQGKAIKQFDGKELRGRPVVLKIALDKEHKKTNAENEVTKTEPVEKQAPAPATVTA